MINMKVLLTDKRNISWETSYNVSSEEELQKIIDKHNKDMIKAEDHIEEYTDEEGQVKTRKIKIDPTPERQIIEFKIISIS